MELRWNPLLREWIIVSWIRKERPTREKEECPFCVGSPEIPRSGWKVLSIPNRFPSLSPDAPPILSGDPLYKVKEAKGFCEVVLYTPNHNANLYELDTEHVKELVDLWAKRYEELGSEDFVKYVFIFENRGREVGTSLEHPHGQIYAFPFVPPRIKRELISSGRFMRNEGRCIFCEIIEKEKAYGKRVICESRDFMCFVPFFARWPYEVHLYPKRHVQSITGLSVGERYDLASALKLLQAKFDGLFGRPFPYVMAFHQKPTDGNAYPHYHFHIEFYTPLRERDKLKFLAGVEHGAGVMTYDYLPEEKAGELRRALTATATGKL